MNFKQFYLQFLHNNFDDSMMLTKESNDILNGNLNYQSLTLQNSFISTYVMQNYTKVSNQQLKCFLMPQKINDYILCYIKILALMLIFSKV